MLKRMKIDTPHLLDIPDAHQDILEEDHTQEVDLPLGEEAEEVEAGAEVEVPVEAEVIAVIERGGEEEDPRAQEDPRVQEDPQAQEDPRVQEAQVLQKDRLAPRIRDLLVTKEIQEVEAQAETETDLVAEASVEAHPLINEVAPHLLIIETQRDKK